ncbi:hypothetical protein FB451DRAFT_1501235 [Mycena latifolia]|nr:hypothetical protein FB451DRAFT_1501235 [Mycena latifolia]
MPGAMAVLLLGGRMGRLLFLLGPAQGVLLQIGRTAVEGRVLQQRGGVHRIERRGGTLVVIGKQRVSLPSIASSTGNGYRRRSAEFVIHQQLEELEDEEMQDERLLTGTATAII